MIRRPRRVVPATLVALVLLAVCVGVAVAVAQSLLGKQPYVTLGQILGVTSRQHWSSGGVIATAVVLAVLGLVLLFLAVRPGRPTVLPLEQRVDDNGEPGADAGVRRNSLSKDLQSVCSSVPGVATSAVTAGRSRIVATVGVVGREGGDTTEQVRQSLVERLTDIAPRRMPAVRVRARQERES